MPGDVAGGCITVLASIGFALLVTLAGPRLLGVLRQPAAAAVRPLVAVARSLSMPQLCVSRT